MEENIKLLKEFLEKYPSLIVSLDKNNKEMWSYVMVEWWQYLAQLLELDVHYTTTAIPNWWKAECKLMKDWRTSASGNALATTDEPFLASWKPYVVLSMAETRAFSKAMRNKYWRIMVELWYSATPLEEMISVNWVALSWFSKKW